MLHLLLEIGASKRLVFRAMDHTAFCWEHKVAYREPLRLLIRSHSMFHTHVLVVAYSLYTTFTQQHAQIKNQNEI